MNISALEVWVGTFPMGVLFLLGDWWQDGQVRFVAHESFAEAEDPPLLSLSFASADAVQHRAMWRLRSDSRFNGQPDKEGRVRLPCFFQNLLPEGVFAKHVAEQAHTAVNDYFHLLAACGADLPGAVRLTPYRLDSAGIDRLLGSHPEPIELTVMDDPVDGALSLSGVQPKLGLIREGARFVARTKAVGRHVIAKLPVVGFPGMPQLEYLSLRLAAAVGVETCVASLLPIGVLQAEHDYDLGDEANDGRFLCLDRFDRDGGESGTERIHCEDFAQILDRYPNQKYQGSYLEIAAAMLRYPSLGEEAIYELMRRIVVNDLIGNTDMHLKNISVLYPDGRRPILAPAYDIVAYCVHYARQGHAMPLIPSGLSSMPRVRPGAQGVLPDGYPGFDAESLVVWADVLGLSLPRCKKLLKEVVATAREAWPALIDQSEITRSQKNKLRVFLANHRLFKQGAI